MLPAMSKNLPQLLLFTAFMILTAANSSFSQENSDTPEQVSQLSEFSQLLKVKLAAGIMTVKDKANAERYEGIATFYHEHEFEPIWIKDGQISSKAHKAVSVLLQADQHGLNPDDYQSAKLFQELTKTNSADLADLELKLTRSVVAYAQHLNAGRLNPQAVNREIVVFPEAVTPGKILEKLKITKSVAAFLRFMAPYTPRYERLRVALENYKTIAAKGSWTVVEKGKVLKPGMSDSRITAIRQRMIEDESLSSDAREGEVYDDALVEAVKKFQIRHGLDDDGVVGPQTLAEMNVSIKQRISTIKVNLERRRWMQNSYGRYYIFSNLADQIIKLVRDEKNLHFELIQVGQPYHRTPVFSDVMEYIEINPYWNVPYSIATKEYLPKLKSNPGALVSQRIQVLANGKIVSPFSTPWHSFSRGHFPVRLRQDSGPKNALGRVKFMFPNKFNVYIHDTPSKSKFNKVSRYFSHGCLRLRDPLTLAEKILGKQGWSRKKIEATVRSGKRTIVKLKEKIPVHVTYLTAWVNKDNSVHFRQDIYGRDKILDAALQKASTG
ncbi:MAG: L,D-transpeptidase family protein [Hyphomicrobiales bacterium]|nr:L,D-transpeptidase family protein [Hyphomicrobiales bacterium]